MRCLQHAQQQTRNKYQAMEGPNQAMLEQYFRCTFGNGKATGDLNPTICKTYPRVVERFASQKYSESESFQYSNWKKAWKDGKTCTQQCTQTGNDKVDNWHNEFKKHKSSVLTQLDNAHKDLIRQNRAYIKVIIECLLYIYKARQNRFRWVLL